MNSPNWKRFLLGAMVGAMLNGCGQPLPAEDNLTRDEVIRTAQPLPTPVEHDAAPIEAATEKVERYGDGSEWRCSLQKYSAAEAPSDFVTFEPNPAVIWPGSLLQGATLESGAPEPIAVKRAGGTVLMNLLNNGAGSTAKSYQVHLDELKQGNVIDAQNSILANNSGSTPAAFEIQTSRVDSEQEMALAMHANVSWLSSSASASMKFSTDKRYTRYLVSLTQRYYTMVYETPTSLDDIFAPSVTAAELARYVGPTNPATYISSVTYGRQFYLLFESTASAQELETALSYSYNGLVTSVSVDVQASYKKVQSETNIKAFVVGGGAPTALEGVLSAQSGKFDALHQFIVAGSEFSASNPGLPLSYSVRNVSDNKLVKVSVATEFVRKSCIPVVKVDSRMGLWLDAQQETAANGQLINTWKGHTVAQNDGIGQARYASNGIGGHPAMFFNYMRDQGKWASFQVALGGGEVVDRDYTVIAVQRSAGADLATDPDHGKLTGGYNFFLGGDSDWGRNNLHLGFENGSTLVHGMFAYDLRANARPATGGDVVSFTFSKTEGKTAWQNGILRGAAKDQTLPLGSNPGSHIGASYWWQFLGYVGEVREYAYKLSPMEQKTVECELGAKWSIGVEGCVDGKPDPALMRY